MIINLFGWHIYIRRSKAKTNAERTRKCLKKRRAAGLCVQCGKQVKESHVRKGKAMLYRKCKRCRGLEREIRVSRSYLPK